MRSDYGTERWRELAAAVKRRDGWRCARCGALAQLDAHHIHPVGDGGSMWDPDNIETLCRRCHQDQHPGWGEPREPVAHTLDSRSVVEAERSSPAPKRGAWAAIGVIAGIAGVGVGQALLLGLALAFLGVNIVGTWLVAEWLQLQRWPAVAAWFVAFWIVFFVTSTAAYLAFLLLAGAGVALARTFKWLWRHPPVVVAVLAGALLATVWLVWPQHLPWNQAAPRSESVAPRPTATASPAPTLSVHEYAARCATWDWHQSQDVPETYGELTKHFADTLAYMQTANPPLELVEIHDAATARIAALRDASARRDDDALLRIGTDAEAPENAALVRAYENTSVGAMRELVAAGCINVVS